MLFLRRRQWHPTPVLLPGKSHGRRSLVGCSPWGSGRVGHDWATSLSLLTFMHWRRRWQPTPVFLPGESQGWGAWWAAFYGVAQSWTRLKRLSSSSRCFLGSIQEVMVSQYVNMIHQALQSDLADLAGWMVVFFLLCYSVSFPLGTLSAKLRRTTSSDRTDCSILSRI